MKKLLSLILCIAISLFAVACNGDGGDPTVTEDGKVILTIPIGWGGGVGTEGGQENAKLFSADPNWGNKQYGKYTGVVVKYVEGSAPNSVDEYKSTTFALTSLERGQSNIGELKEGLVCLDDVYASTVPGETKTIEEKLFPEYRKYFQGGDGHYYGLVGGQMHCGYAMYTQLWERDQLYIAHATVDGVADPDQQYYIDNNYHSYHSAKFGCTIYFSDYDGDGTGFYDYTGFDFATPNGQFQTSKDDLCVGPDGIAGTYDDGQPSSVIEFLTLCAYMEDETNGIKADPRPNEGRGNDKLANYDAVAFSGKHKSGYGGLFLDAFFANLAGENYEAVLTFDSEGRDVEVVVGYSSDDLYPGINYIKKPITKKVKITPECGYYTTWMVEKYYTEAVMNIMQKEGYFNFGTENQSSNVDAQYDFLVGGLSTENNSKQEACAFIIDGSYLNNEMRLNGHFDLIQSTYSRATDMRMEFAVPPTSINTPVTCEEEGDAPSLVPVSRSASIIPIKVAEDPDKLAAVKAWLLYQRSDVAGARNFMYTCSIPITAGNDLMDIIESNPSAGLADHEYFNYYKKRYIEYYSAAYNAGRVRHPIGGEYMNSYTASNFYRRGFESGLFDVSARGTCYSSLVEFGFKATFEGSLFDKTSWDKVYVGTTSYANVPDSAKSYKIDGQDVVFTK